MIIVVTKKLFINKLNRGWRGAGEARGGAAGALRGGSLIWPFFLGGPK